MTVKEVERVLYASHLQSLGAMLTVPNYTGPGAFGECDIVSIAKNGDITEYELKTNLADVKREWRKKAKHEWLQGTRSQFRCSFTDERWAQCIDRAVGASREWYSETREDEAKPVRWYLVAPMSLAEAVQHQVPQLYGVIGVDEGGAYGHRIIRRASNLPAARALTPLEMIKAGRAACFRLWKHKMGWYADAPEEIERRKKAERFYEDLKKGLSPKERARREA